MDQQTHDMGKFYGYPECCIKWFSEERIEKDFNNLAPLTPAQEAAHNYNGFVPCPVCAEKITSKTIGTLIHDRVCPKDYPNG